MEQIFGKEKGRVRIEKNLGDIFYFDWIILDFYELY